MFWFSFSFLHLSVLVPVRPAALPSEHWFLTNIRKVTKYLRIVVYRSTCVRTASLETCKCWPGVSNSCSVAKMLKFTQLRLNYSEPVKNRSPCQQGHDSVCEQKWRCDLPAFRHIGTLVWLLCLTKTLQKEQKITLVIGLELYCGKSCLACSVINLRSERTTGLDKRQINILDSSLEENYM